MPSVFARVLFLSALGVNVLIWSRSRYGQPLQGTQHSISGVTLAKRAFLELTGDVQSLGGEESACRPLTVPTHLQCQHVKEHCQNSETVLEIQYLHNYYCTEKKLQPLMFTGLIVWLLFLFSTLGISASDFFTPNLGTIAQLLGLDESVAGVTFLAFGNGSPDVFSTFSAMKANSGSLAIGELLGAATFIVSCVVGSMCIIKPFQVHRGPFLRDVGFFTTAVALLLFILSDGYIHPWESGMLVMLYFFYVAVVVVGSWWDKRRQRRRAREALVRSEYQDDGVFESYTDTPRSSDTLQVQPVYGGRSRAISAPAPPPQLPSFSLIGALEFRDVVQSLRREASATSSLGMFESPVTPYAGGHYHSPYSTIRRGRRPSSILSQGEDHLSDSVPLLDTRTRPTSPIQDTAYYASAPGRLQPNEADDYFSATNNMDTSVPSILRTPASPTLSDGQEILYTPPTKKQRVADVSWKIFHTAFPTLAHLPDASWMGRIAGVFAAPAVFLLTVTLPVVVTRHEESQPKIEKPTITLDDSPLVEFNDEEEAMERVLHAEEEMQEEIRELSYSKWLMGVQCVLGPLFCVVVLYSGLPRLWLLIAILVGGFVAGITVVIVGGDGTHTSGRMMRCSMGFLVAIFWIMAIADEVVNVLQTFGIIFGLSDAIIGLTIFAVGNSLADLVANMSVAVFAPIMGFSACFGGPMLNILLGVGGAGTYIMRQSNKSYPLALSPTLLVSSVGLLILLVGTLIYVPLNDYYLSRRWGVLLICSYLVIMTTNVIVEIRT
ncbi:Sodium/calcium exchanger protein-domain-containing protein [Coprinopsis sp. MPI-PUGE-AT-0042]|nr:Sodium/calcium exchanger protein-domain-containing protein [Coprinopsis sp. MPI-PUGE-AT-0042]